jgi:flagellar biosynthesis/type III secretory pathway protein FliH
MVEHNSIKMKKTFAILLAVCFLMSVAAATVSAAPVSAATVGAATVSAAPVSAAPVSAATAEQLKLPPVLRFQPCTPNSPLYKKGYAVGYEDGFAAGHAECMHTIKYHKNSRSQQTGCWETGFNAGYPIGYQAGLHSCKRTPYFNEPIKK